MQNISLEKMSEALTLTEAAKLIPGRPSLDTMRRWVRKGLKSGAKLKTFRVGRTPYTTPQAVEEFIAAQNQDPTSPRRHANAESELASLGV